MQGSQLPQLLYSLPPTARPRTHRTVPLLCQHTAASALVQSLSLAELFRRAEALVGRLDSTPPASPEGRRLVADGLRLLAQAAQLVESAALFSPNEDREDLATSDLRYLLVPFYRGELLAQAVSPGGCGRGDRRGCVGAAGAVDAGVWAGVASPKASRCNALLPPSP